MNTLDGYKTFKKDVFPKHEKLFNSLKNGQSPKTLMITCSDSRIDPNMITSTLPGELFVIRNAGNIIPEYGTHFGGEAATIEYAVNALGVEEIIVCGHSKCGAMDAICKTRDEIAALPAVCEWLDHAPRTKAAIEEKNLLQSDSPLDSVIEENVRCQLEVLASHPSVKEKLSTGELSLKGWIYEFETGRLKTMNPDGRWNYED